MYELAFTIQNGIYNPNSMGWVLVNDKIMSNNCYHGRMINQLDQHDSFWCQSGRLNDYQTGGAVL
jgi:hypothetical protein